MNEILKDGGCVGLAQINPIAGNLEYNSEKCTFMYDSIKLLFDHCNANDKNSKFFVALKASEAKGMIFSMLSNLINSNTLPTGEFNKEAAMEAFETWFDHIIKYKNEINETLKVPIYSQEKGEVQEFSIKEAIKIAPENIIYDSDLYRITRVIAGESSDIIQ